MFKSKTVFVVGAGASCEFGLPSGDALKRIIAQALDIRFEHFGRLESGDSRIVHALHQHTGGQISNINPHLNKAWRIRDAMPAAISIDNYLDAHQGDDELELCGKLAIVKSILDSESNCMLRSSDHYRDVIDINLAADTWILRFMRSLTEGVRKSDVDHIFDNVAMVVFNYDRCIERYIVPALAGYYALSEEEAVSIARRLRIYHPYGQVGPLPWQNSGAAGVPFGNGGGADLLAIARGIKTFTEGQDDQVVMDPILQVMSEAETLVFLGFAYHQQNLALITPPTTQISRTYGTSRGISHNNTLEVINAIQQMLGYEMIHPSLAESKHNIHIEGSNCAKLFDDYSRGLTAGIRS